MPRTRTPLVLALLALVVAPVLTPPVVGAADLAVAPRAIDGIPTTEPLAGPTPESSRDRPPPALAAPSRTDCPAAGSAIGGTVRAAYPNPVALEDRGEFVVVEFPAGTTLSGWTLSDGETNATLPDQTVSGAVAVTMAPDVARNRSGLPVVVIEDDLSLSNAGETVTLECDGRVVDSLAYADAPEAELWTGSGWRPLGATDHSPVVVRDAPIRTFALPDAPEVPIETLRNADRRILLGGYTFGSARVAGLLRAAADRGVRVRVLLEGGPVGGMDRRTARLLDDLARSGVEVRVLTGPYARYAFHHPKYAVVDDSVLVTSENWKPSGTGGHGSRGWGVVVRSDAIATAAADVFRSDAGWRAATPWSAFRHNRSFQPASGANGSLPAWFQPRRLQADRVRLLVAPDNAEAGVVRLLRSANRSIAVEQVSVESGSPFLREAVAAARRGVRVRVLLDSAWYVRDDNARLAARLNGLAENESLPLAAKLVEPRSRFEKIHVKGVVVDGERVVVGSLNWNNHSARENREVIVVLEGEAVGEYYRRLFLADWRGGAWRLPIGVAVALAVAGIVAVVVGYRTITFEDEPSGFDDSAWSPGEGRQFDGRSRR